MRDEKITLPRVKSLHPAIAGEVELLIDTAEAGLPEGISIRIVEALRTIEYQNILYAKGRTTGGAIVTNARGGSSYHNYGLAIDGCILKDGMLDWVSPLWPKVVKVFKDAGYTWGGDFQSIKDRPHFEKTFGLHWKEMLRRYHNDLFIPHTKYILL